MKLRKALYRQVALHLTYIVWSDPRENNGWNASARGSGFLYGPDIARKFNHENNIQFICRSHELAMMAIHGIAITL